MTKPKLTMKVAETSLNLVTLTVRLQKTNTKCSMQNLDYILKEGP